MRDDKVVAAGLIFFSVGFALAFAFCLGGWIGTIGRNQKLQKEAIQNGFADQVVENNSIVFKWKNQDLCEKGQSLNGECKPETAFTDDLLLHSRSCPQCWNRVFKGNVKDYEHCMKLLEESEE